VIPQTLIALIEETAEDRPDLENIEKACGYPPDPDTVNLGTTRD
jgi:hypothetical protein